MGRLIVVPDVPDLVFTLPDDAVPPRMPVTPDCAAPRLLALDHDDYYAKHVGLRSDFLI